MSSGCDFILRDTIGIEAVLDHAFTESDAVCSNAVSFLSLLDAYHDVLDFIGRDTAICFPSATWMPTQSVQVKLFFIVVRINWHEREGKRNSEWLTEWILTFKLSSINFKRKIDHAIVNFLNVIAIIIGSGRVIWE